MQRHPIDEYSFEVMAVPGLVGVVRFDGRPVAVPDEEIANIKRLSAGLTPEGPEPEVGPIIGTGQRVRVTEGPLRGVEGVVGRRRGSKRVVIVIGHQAEEVRTWYAQRCVCALFLTTVECRILQVGDDACLSHWIEPKV